uniref:Endoplasmic reticulum vesicle transporter C-terminal domain-containing protein n=1 Tax=Noctiluca scintillans TaxID=2966 RepID=A0A7S1FGA4_NOCSC|mmetsp:Transcript_61172/g.162552  ORF Transcript_61172/g.162552 Transcript_61172/m.162552 type:complete len:402 (+) Transcript_61172:93-1298(+)
MKSFDAFGKPVQEFQVKTTCGGYLSICSITIMIVLFIMELQYFLELETKDEMSIDQNQDRKYLNISFSITFFEAPCALLYLNLVDPKQVNVMHVVHDIYKTRLSPSGTPVGRRVRDGLRNVATTSLEMRQISVISHYKRTPASHQRCGSCYHSHIDEDDCCDSCEKVRESFKDRGWDDDPKDYVFEQCISEAYAETPPGAGEGCQIDARLHVRKVPATLQLGLGKTLSLELLGTSDTKGFISTLSFDHEIRNLSFGVAFPGLVPVLDGRKKIDHKQESTEHHQYDIHVIPTRYNEDGNDEIVSHQYSVTEHMKVIDQSARDQDLVASGLIANYDFTPFEVKVTKTRKSLVHFFTECCAILGGIFSFSGMLDNLSHRLSKTMARSRRTGTRGSQLAELPSCD